MTRRLGSFLVTAALLVLAACSHGSPTTRSAPGPDRPASFAARRVTWAQATTLHYGAQTFALPGDVDGLWRSSYGFLVSLHQHGTPDATSEVLFFDGTDTTPVKGDPGDIAISPNGRYAGWIDFDGPKRPLGRLAEVVVMDLKTGQELFRNRQDMGSATDDLTDLYEDAEVHFLGFDDHAAYWHTPVGDEQLKRARIRRHYDFQSRPPGEDHSRGVLASCDLPSGACRTVRPLTGTDSVVWAVGSSETFP